MFLWDADRPYDSLLTSPTLDYPARIERPGRGVAPRDHASANKFKKSSPPPTRFSNIKVLRDVFPRAAVL